MPTVPTLHSLPMPADMIELAIDRAMGDYMRTSDMLPVVVEVEIGHGFHTHDDACDGMRSRFGCLQHCSNSDYIITLQYATCGWQTMFGVIVSADGTPEFVTWQD